VSVSKTTCSSSRKLKQSVYFIVWYCEIWRPVDWSVTTLCCLLSVYLEGGGTNSSFTSKTIYEVTGCDIPEDVHLHKDRCESLKCRILIWVKKIAVCFHHDNSVRVIPLQYALVQWNIKQSIEGGHIYWHQCMRRNLICGRYKRCVFPVLRSHSDCRSDHFSN